MAGRSWIGTTCKRSAHGATDGKPDAALSYGRGVPSGSNGMAERRAKPKAPSKKTAPAKRKRAAPAKRRAADDSPRDDKFLTQRLTANGRRHYAEVLADYSPAAKRLDKPLPLAIVSDLARALDDYDVMHKAWAVMIKQRKWDACTELEPQMHRLRASISKYRELIQRSLGQERRDTYTGKKQALLAGAKETAQHLKALRPPTAGGND